VHVLLALQFHHHRTHLLVQLHELRLFPPRADLQLCPKTVD
jgi:hypothetical protein